MLHREVPCGASTAGGFPSLGIWRRVPRARHNSWQRWSHQMPATGNPSMSCGHASPEGGATQTLSALAPQRTGSPPRNCPREPQRQNKREGNSPAALAPSGFTSRLCRETLTTTTLSAQPAALAPLAKRPLLS
ncbi:hypothetical protein DP115_17705 [Brasilonema octagenarum UFV-OR1]|uniref:Uncharacterized protein n=1 Tax=Brasilonema octagenarum UFV-OR1 TaxID=417115 RepID=A0ABX1MBV0_9CYAN|nr:hypothetical protein [Brasilonema octagenarum UFV-OR1]